MFVVYIHPKCSTCRNALDWLTRHGIPHRIESIRERPPSIAELHDALRLMNGRILSLFNTSGMDYRSMNLRDRLPRMDTEEALRLLSSNGMLVKRPFLIGRGVALAGFKPEVWKDTLAKT
jgi:arsenate reductase